MGDLLSRCELKLQGAPTPRVYRRTRGPGLNPRPFVASGVGVVWQCDPATAHWRGNAGVHGLCPSPNMLCLAIFKVDAPHPDSRLRATMLTILCLLLSQACGSADSHDADAGAPPPAEVDVSHRALVVGAGLSGLTAAIDLRDAGWEVVVLEARDRVGGRVLTLHAPFSPGLHAEAGGESIDDNHDALQAECRHYGLPLERRPAQKEEGGVAYYQGKRVPMSDFVTLQGGQVAWDYLAFSPALLQLADGLDPEHPELFAHAKELDARSLEDFVVEQKLVPEAEFLVRVANRASYASELSDVSLLFAAQQAVVLQDVPDSAAEAMRITGGNSKLPEAMARDLGDIIQLRAPVTRVEELTDRVRITAQGKVYEGAFAVLAIPAPPLRAIAFTPPLPTGLRDAVRELELGPAAKVITEYTASFWNNEHLTGFTVMDEPMSVAWAATDSYKSGHGLLAQFLTGSVALSASKMSEATRIKTFQSALGRVYPEGAKLRIDHVATMSWVDERYTGGAYATYRPGQMVRFFPAFRQGTARLRFAGEHTEALIGYMESAIRSGHRVAKELGKPVAPSASP